jgi:hypothetical protein
MDQPVVYVNVRIFTNGMGKGAQLFGAGFIVLDAGTASSSRRTTIAKRTCTPRSR